MTYTALSSSPQLQALVDAAENARARAVHPAGDISVVCVPSSLWDALIEALSAIEPNKETHK